MTWENTNKMVQENITDLKMEVHAKFTNYSFDKDEFVRLVVKAATNVRNHRKYKDFIEKINHDEL